MKKLQLFKCVSDKSAKLEDDFPAFKDFEKKGMPRPDQNNPVLQKLVKERNEQGNTALHYAAKSGNSYKCRALKFMGAEIKVENNNGMTPLEFAARQGDGKPDQVFKCIAWLLKEEKLEDWTLTLWHAIKNKNWGAETYAANQLIKSGKCKIQDTDQDGNTSLHLAAMFDKEKEDKILELFLEHENIKDGDLIECLKATNSKKSTPFHIACNVGNHESVEQLIKKARKLDVDVSGLLNSRDANKRLPIYAAVDTNNIELLKVLTSRDIDLEMTENDVNRAAR